MALRHKWVLSQKCQRLYLSIWKVKAEQKAIGTIPLTQCQSRQFASALIFPRLVIVNLI